MKSKKIITENDANRENWKRHDKEHNVVFPSMLTGLRSLMIKRIDIRTEDRNNHEHTDVKENKFYLVGHAGRWTISKPKRTYHDNGWEFNVGHYYMGLGMIDFLFEIKNLPEYKENPLGRVEPTDDEYEDRF